VCACMYVYVCVLCVRAHHSVSKVIKIATNLIGQKFGPAGYKLIVAQLVKKFPAFYGTRRFIIVFIRDRYPDSSPSEMCNLISK
jgi:hypothetical protein